MVTALMGLPAMAEAQIYSWRDGQGRLVLSDRPLDPSAKLTRSYAVSRSSGVRTTRRTSPKFQNVYDDSIEHHATQNGVRPDLVRAVIQVESAFNPRAVSPKGALGLMQLMPATAAELGIFNPFNPIDNIRGGVQYLRQLLDRYAGNEELALAAYNAGPRAVDRHGQRVPPYRETRDYVQKIRSTTDVQTVGGSAGQPIYKSIEVIGGRPVPRYSDQKPSGAYDVMPRR